MKTLVFLLLFSSVALGQSKPCPPRYKVIYRFAVAHDTVYINATKHDTIYTPDKNCEQENGVLREALSRALEYAKLYRDFALVQAGKCDTVTFRNYGRDTLTIEPPTIQPFLAIGIRANSHQESLWSLGPGVRLNLGPIVIGCSAAIERQFGIESLNSSSYHTIFYGSFEYNILR